MSSSSEGNVVRMVVGDKFATYDEFEKALAAYEQATKQKFWRRSSHTIKKAVVKRTLKEDLKFYDAQFCCVHGGLRFKSRSKGERQSSTLKMDCPVFIKLLVSSCGNFLQIKSTYLKHENHNLSSNAFEHLPQNRKLAPCERAEAEVLLKLGCDKKKLQNKIATETNKHPTLKDLTNIRSALKSVDENDLVKAVKLLEKKYNAAVSVLHDEDNNFKGLYFSTEDMRNSMSSWPEIVLIDGTYKLLAQDFTLILLLVEDSNGLSEVVGACLIVHEDRETFKWFLESFKSENRDACAKINCFMADKDLLERDVLKEVFGCPVYICLFHTLKTFSRQITPDRMGSSNQMKRQDVLQMLQGLVYSVSDEDYTTKYEKFCEKVPKGVLEYYNQNWHPIKQEWTVYSMTYGNLNNRTNNRLESINKNIKQVVQKRSTLKAFIEHFFVWLNSHKFERDHKAALHVLKRPVTVFAPESCESQYLSLVTTYAFPFVLQSIEKSNFIKNEHIFQHSVGLFRLESRKGIINTTSMSCDCGFWTSMCLPCKHIFAIRRFQELPLYEKELVDVRWTKEYYLTTQRTFRDQSNPRTTPSSPTPSVTNTTPQRTLTLTEKRKRASLITSSLVTIAALAPKSEFLCKLQVLKDIEKFWREGFEVTVNKIETRNFESSTSSISDGPNDLCMPESDDNFRPLPTISEISEDGDFDLSCLDSTIVQKVLDWDTEFDFADLTKYLQSSSTAHLSKDPIDGSITPQPPGSSVLPSANLASQVELTENDNTRPVNTEDPSLTAAIIQRPTKIQPATAAIEESAASGSATIDENISETQGMATTSSISDDCTSSLQTEILEKIIMPGPIRVRGRPKGATLTAIGLKISRTRRSAKTCIAFAKQPAKNQIAETLRWCVTAEIVPDVLSGKYLVKESDLEVRPELINDAILDESVALNMLQKYMDPDAFDSILNTVEIKRKTATWKCTVCTKKLETNTVLSQQTLNVAAT